MTKPSYSLWLSPAPGASRDTLGSLIGHLPGPGFAPHCTLLGEAPPMEVEELLTKIETVVTEWRKAEAIAQQDEIGAGKGLEITFRKVTVGEEYYRCVLIELNEAPALFDLHERLLAALPSPSERPTYYPHVSLLYSHIDKADRERIVAALYDSKLARIVDGGRHVELVKPGEEASDRGVSKALCDRISVCVTKGVDVEKWEVAGEVRLD